MNRSPKIFFQKYKSILPLLLLTILILKLFFSFFKGTVDFNNEIIEFGFSSMHYLATLLISINYFIYFFVRKYYKFIIVLTLILGLFNFISFTPILLHVAFGFGEFELGFQPVIFLIGLISYAINYKGVHEMFNLYFGPSQEEAEKKYISYQENEIERFTAKYKSYTSDQLEVILHGDKYSEEAKIAAKRILDKLTKI